MEIGPNFLSAQSAAAGANWAAFPAYVCGSLSILNNSGTDIHLRRKGEVAASRVLLLKDGQAWMMRSITNASEVEFRRADVSNTQATLHAEAE